MESELAKTLRSMSDDHRMVPDFSEKLLDVADAIELQAKDLDAGRELMRQAWDQFNSIRARDGAPVGISPNWFDQMTDELAKLLGDDCKPWMIGAARALLVPAEVDLCREQDARIKAEQERDAALAEVERLKVQRDKAMAIGGVNFCAACGDEPVLEELQDSDIPGLGRTFCQKCRVAIGQSDLAS